MATPKENVPLIKCRYCDRKFAAEALQRHEPICAKSAAKKRKPFDSHKQRVEGTELQNYRPPKTTGRGGKSGAVAGGIGGGRSTSNWRQKHEELVGAIRNARQTKRAMETGGPLPPPPPPSINPDYVQCPYCGRRFNETAAERHIPFCKSRNEKLPPMKTSTKPTAGPTPAAAAPRRPAATTASAAAKSTGSSGVQAGRAPVRTSGTSLNSNSGNNLQRGNTKPRAGAATTSTGSYRR